MAKVIEVNRILKIKIHRFKEDQIDFSKIIIETEEISILKDKGNKVAQEEVSKNNKEQWIEQVEDVKINKEEIRRLKEENKPLKEEPRKLQEK